MLIHKNSLSIVGAASTDDTRPALNGLHVRTATADKPAIIEATNGHYAVRQTLPTTVGNADFPVVEGFQLPDDNPGADVIIPTEICKKLQKAIPKPKRGSLPILQHVAVNLADNNGTVRAVTTDLESPTFVNFQPVEGPYPDIDSVWDQANTSQAVFKISYNAVILRQLCDVLIAANKDQPTTYLDFTFAGPAMAAIAKVQGANLSGLIMPVLPNEG